MQRTQALASKIGCHNNEALVKWKEWYQPIQDVRKPEEHLEMFVPIHSYVDAVPTWIVHKPSSDHRLDAQSEYQKVNGGIAFKYSVMCRRREMYN